MKFVKTLSLLVICVAIFVTDATQSQKNAFLRRLNRHRRSSNSNSLLIVPIRIGQKVFRLDCTPFCDRNYETRTYVLDCNNMQQPFLNLCGFCRLKYRCGASDQAFH